MKIQLSPDWSEFLSVAAHGDPQLTEDLDVFVGTSQENAASLHRALVAVGVGEAAPSEPKEQKRRE